MELQFKFSHVYDGHLHRRRINFHAVRAYGRKLGAEGWTYSESDGAYISPDRSAAYYTDRSPYYGRVMKYSTCGNYRATIAKLWLTNNFKAYLSEMEKRAMREAGKKIRLFAGMAATAALFDAIIIGMLLYSIMN